MNTTTGLTAATRKTLKATVDAIRNRLPEDLYVATARKFSLAARDRSRLELSPRVAREYTVLKAWADDPLRSEAGFEANVQQLVKEVAYTLTNRLFILRQLEARRIHSLPILTGLRESSGYKEFAEYCPELCRGEDGGYRFLLKQRFDQMALDLPGFFAHNPLHAIIDLPGPTLFWLIEQLNQSALDGAWSDDTTLGWLYQYWNDPDRTAVNDKVAGKKGNDKKIYAHEIAHATQLFTERYMVEWLLQNSLGTQWLAICQKHGWQPEALAIIEGLEKKRADWREKLSQGEVYEDEALPIDNEAEARWKYYVQQAIPADVIKAAPDSLKDVKVLDPACGSGHFLVYAFDLLYAFYHEEAQLSGQATTPAEIVNQILSHNLHGIDIDPRAVQLAAAALLIKAQAVAPGFQPSRLNLVSTDLGLGQLAPNDPSIQRFKDQLTHNLADPEMINRLIDTLRGADYLGSLMQVEQVKSKQSSLPLFQSHAEGAFEDALQAFLNRHDAGEDLGVRTRAEQLAKGLRVIALLQQKYEVVCANPPYLGLSKTADTIKNHYESTYKAAKADLYTLFLLRNAELTTPNGFNATVAMHGWMFLITFDELRKQVIEQTSIRCLAHLGAGAFQAISGEVTQVSMFVSNTTFPTDKTEGVYFRTVRSKEKDKALLTQQDVFHFQQNKFQDIKGAPMIYWWPEEFRSFVLSKQKYSSVRSGMHTGNVNRFVRSAWEIRFKQIHSNSWAPYVKSSGQKRWVEFLDTVVNWKKQAKEKTVVHWFYGSKGGGNGFPSRDNYFHIGLSFPSIGNTFSARVWDVPSIFADASNSYFNSKDINSLLSGANSRIMQYVMNSVSPTVNFKSGEISKVGKIEANPKEALKMIKHSQELAQSIEYLVKNFEGSNYSLEHYELAEIISITSIDNEIYAQFQSDTVAAIKAEVGESPGNYPQLSEAEPTQAAERYPDFADIYLNGPYKYEYGQKKLKADGTPERGRLQSLEELCHEFQLHPESIIALRKQLGLQRKSDRQDEAYRHLAWALGVALGRFDAQTGGLVDLAAERRGDEPIDTSAPKALPHGMFMVSERGQAEGLDAGNPRQNQGLAAYLKGILAYKHGAAKADEVWAEIEAALVFDGKDQLTAKDRAKYNFNQFLRDSCFDFHNSVYEKRPIYFPLSSAKRSYVVWCNIHTWHDATLKTVLADFLMPEQRELTRRLDEMRLQKNSATGKAQSELEDSISLYQKWRDELEAFIVLVQQIDQQGANPAKQERPHPFVMDLDDGVMVNSAALWPLLHPQWKEPKTWWGHLEKPVGKNDYDWSHLAMRYWPQRCWQKLVKDPSLAVAHSDYGDYTGRDLFQELHPEMAAKWEAEQRKDS